MAYISFPGIFYIQQIRQAASSLRVPRDTTCLLESRVGVGQELLEVGFEPGSGLRCWLEGIRVTAVVVVPRGARVASSVALTRGLDPHKSVLKLETGARGGTGTEPGADGIAPVTPSGLTGRLLARSALIGDEVCVETRIRQERSNGVDVQVFVVVGIAWTREAKLVSQFHFCHFWGKRGKSVGVN